MHRMLMCLTVLALSVPISLILLLWIRVTEFQVWATWGAILVWTIGMDYVFKRWSEEERDDT